MGREAEGMIRYLGAEGAGRILIEGAEVILRGEVRGKIPREAITAVRVEGDDLVLTTACGPVVATVGAAVAEGLSLVLRKPVPTLAEKLGLTGMARAGCLWPVTDPALAAALAGQVVPVAEATILVAEIMDEGALERLVQALPALAGRHVWCVNGKGPRPPLPEARIREALRAAGWIDSKTTAVSQTMSATRYGLRKG
jgi:hypothetical protein